MGEDEKTWEEEEQQARIAERRATMGDVEKAQEKTIVSPDHKDYWRVVDAAYIGIKECVFELAYADIMELPSGTSVILQFKEDATPAMGVMFPVDILYHALEGKSAIARLIRDRQGQIIEGRRQ